ncbi:hypothetical protein [Tsuneonella sp. SYSU-LHT278]|uniref:hypothetical protein n=1 Tax=Tsuneonella sediminis TaxID=3416089 RepID=UPI003F7AB43D
MATLASDAPALSLERSERRFFFIMALAMASTIVAGFVLNLATGRSTFASPLAYHVHAVIFMGWIALYLTQAFTIATGRRALHRALGKFAYLWIPAMLAAGVTIMTVAARRHGGPFFFALNEFLISNVMLLACFAGLALWALLSPRHNGWHRRLMLVAMAVLTGPGIGRLLPLPLIPQAWSVTFVATLVFPAIAVVADKRRRGRVHPAYWWGTGIYAATFAVSMLIAYSGPGIAFTQWVVAGSPGAERPLEPYVPPGFAM